MSLTGWLTDLRLGLPTENACRRAARAEPIERDVQRLRVLARYHLYATVRDQSLSPALATKGRFDPWTGRLLRQHVKPGMHVADVGANVGYFTLLMADRVGSGGHVHAFEPSDEMCGLMRRSLVDNGFADRVTLHEAPLSEEDGREMILVTPGDHLGGAAIWEAHHSHPSARPVRTRRFDAVDGADRIAVAKIDAEGSEFAIWEGMTGLLAGNMLRTILIEYSPGCYADPAAFLRRMDSAGFRIAKIDPARGPRACGLEGLGAIAPDQVVNLLLTR